MLKLRCVEVGALLSVTRSESARTSTFDGFVDTCKTIPYTSGIVGTPSIMPFLTAEVHQNKKRKRSNGTGRNEHTQDAKQKAPKRPTDGSMSRQDVPIMTLESQILESRKHYNKIPLLIELGKRPDGTEAIIALCRVFCRLMAAGSLKAIKGAHENELTIVEWLKDRYTEYWELILDHVTDEEHAMQRLAVKLGMQLIREEGIHLPSGSEYVWGTGSFADLVRHCVELESAGAAREEFAEEYVQRYDDVKFFTSHMITKIIKQPKDTKTCHVALQNCVELMLAFERAPGSVDDLDSFYGEKPERAKHPMLSVSRQKKQVQAAWLAILSSQLDQESRKRILGAMTEVVVPWFTQVELLMDFLTDSYDKGGATSLLALSGLFYLMQEKNLDYPFFYQKLYSLLDEDLLHSRHRSRFFRLLNVFMSSTHLPAALVASFIKKLSRLALHAPPAGVVAVIPWIYNMFMKHRSCTFMMHREIKSLHLRTLVEEEGMDDSFDEAEKDPIRTGALESSIWEIVSLQNHWHPNVATLARIVSEQFTKQSYNLEDFLDHSYGTMIEAELGLELKKAPVVEFDIPKSIFVHSAEEEGNLRELMSKILDV